MNEQQFDALLKRELAPPDAAPDSSFVARVDRAVAAADFHRRWRRRVLHQLASRGLAIVAVAASIECVLRVPEVHEALAGTPQLVGPAALVLLLAALLVRPRPGVRS